MSLPDWKTMPADERDALLAQLVAKELPFSKIAAHFRNATRNAIIGKVHRLQDAGGLVKSNNRVKPFTPDEVEEIAGMIRRGVTGGMIADAFRLSRFQMGTRIKREPKLSALWEAAVSQHRPPKYVGAPRLNPFRPKPVEPVVEVDVDPVPYREATGCQFFAAGQAGIDGLVCNRPFHGGVLSRGCRHHYGLVFTPESQRRAA